MRQRLAVLPGILVASALTLAACVTSRVSLPAGPLPAGPVVANTNTGYVLTLREVQGAIPR